MTTGTESLNATTGSPEGDILPGIATTLPIDNLAAGEWREVRVTADLPRPGLEELLYLTISLAAPYAFTTPNGAPVTFDFRRVSVVESGATPTGGGGIDPGYNRARLPRASAALS
ncbi:hypothetical protein [Methanoculleus sp. UBA303]|uniref:hypothetical protein n=1 Tax=Methanoculleus sp. UBA303 TaxID=1915497 RepID=UPI0025F0C33A|nr:hypothetical protein [Methanoculleus sp. UBA303]MDD3932655.1 hypothetical protein [Methanoculleus sp.]